MVKKRISKTNFKNESEADGSGELVASALSNDRWMFIWSIPEEGEYERTIEKPLLVLSEKSTISAKAVKMVFWLHPLAMV